jgi:hypothetical protein
MPQEFPTLNDPVATGTAAASSTADKSAGSTDATPPQGGDKSAADQQTQNANADKGQQGQKTDGADGDMTRFDKHPRFQELIKSKEELTIKAAQLDAQNRLLADQVKTIQMNYQPPQNRVEQPPADDFDTKLVDLNKKLDEGEVSMSEYMKDYTKLVETRTTAKVQAIQAEQQKNMKMSSLETQFLSKNADYMDIVQSGKLEPIKQADPLHDNISAYYAYKAQEAKAGAEKSIQDAIEKTKKETEETMIKNFKAKGRADVLGEGPAHAPAEQGANDARLKQSKKFGGATNLLAARLMESRAKRNSGF